MDAISPKEPHWVLLIDPNSDVQLALTDFLEAHGYRVRSAGSGTDAIKAMEVGVPYSSALLDLALPDMEGIDLLKTLSRYDPHLPVLVITGQVEIDREIQAFHHGVLAFVRKPYSREQLLALLSRAVEVRNLNLQIVELEQAKIDSEERYQLTLDHINDGVFHLDLSGRVNWANQQATILVKCPLKEIIGHPFLEFLSHSSAALAESRLAAIGAGNTVPQVVEFQVVRPDGTEKWIEANVNNVVRQEKVIGWLLIGRDITERKHTELDLRERNRFLELDLEVATLIDLNENISKLLQGCTEALVQHLDAAFARIWLLDETEQILNLCASAGLYTHLDGAHSQIRVGQYKIGLIAAQGKPILTNSVIGDSHVPEQEWAKREGLVAFAGYPMISNQKVLGVMALFARHPLTEFTLKSLAMVAQRITVALERQLATDAKNHLLRFNQNLLTSAGEGIYGLDLSGNTTFVNPAALQMTGYEKDELLGQSQHAMLHHSRFDGSPYPQEECPIYSAFRDGAVHHVNTEVFWRKDGSNFPVQYTSIPIRDQLGELEGAVVTFRDITQLKQTEAVILQGEKKFRSIYEQAPIGIAVLDSANGRFKQINNKYCDITGYSEEEMLNLTFQELTYPDDLQVDLDQMQQLLAGAINSFQIEKRYIRKNGKVIWVNLTCIPLWLEVTDPHIQMAMIEDITQRKKAEKGLKESEEHFRLLSEAIPQQVWTALSDGSLVHVNQRVVEYFGCFFDEIVGQGWQQFLHPDDLPGCLERWAKARDTQQPYEVEFRLRRGADHTYRWHIGRALPVFNQEGQVVKWFGTNTDITQFK
jgi:PAS domain S-box-containing protein